MKTSSYTIFYADDDIDDQEFFKAIISEINPDYKVLIQNNGVELMNVLEKSLWLPQVIFLDLNMPCKDGYEALKEIRASQRLKHLPVIVFSTASNESVVLKAKELGATSFVIKPNSLSDLRAIINAILSSQWDNNTVFKKYG
jgi:CheY-like chemotaxis protein